MTRSISPLFRQLAAAGLMVSLIPLTGCSQGDRPTLGQVSGKVTLDGQPLADATIYFSPDEGGRDSEGFTDSDGNYSLTYIGNVKGAKVGTHTVRAQTSYETEDPKTGAPRRTKELVPAKYREQSQLKKEVKAGKQTIDIELTSD